MVKVNTFRGLLPAIDRRQVERPFVMDGKNFLVDAEGPFSAFGTEFASYTRIRADGNITTFRVEGQIFIFTNNAVLSYDFDSQLFQPEFVFTSQAKAVRRWYHAFVGGRYYFCKDGVGIIRYTPNTNIWEEVTGGNVVNDPMAIIESGGRLVVLGSDAIQWSKIGDGSNTGLQPNIDNGAGLQDLAIIGGGKPLALGRVLDGFITYTTTGLLRSQLVQSLIAFRHVPLSGVVHIPLSHTTFIEFDQNRHLFLTKSGFYSTQGDVPQQVFQLFSEFFRRDVFIDLNIDIDGLFELHYNRDRQWLFVSIAEGEQPGVFTKAYVHYIPREEWGVFNCTHVGFGELSLAEDAQSNFNLGYICTSGCIHRFVSAFYQENAPNRIDYYHYHFQPVFEAKNNNGVTRFPSVINISTIDKGLFPDASGFYKSTKAVLDGTENTSLYQRDLDTIDSEIEVGLFRLQGEDELDRFAHVLDVSVGTDAVITGIAEEDYIDDYPDDVFVDYATGSGTEDWGFGLLSFVDYDVKVIGSRNGYEIYENQSITPLLLKEDGHVRFYTCDVAGIYHSVKLSATEKNKSFHLKTLEITGRIGGTI